jgi:uncharacterized protein (DUF736 family)
MDTQTATREKWGNKEIGALWMKVSQNKGQKYMTGHIQTELEGKVDVVIFTNKDKKNDKAPDFRIYLSDKKQTQGQNQKTATAASPVRTAKPQKPAEATVSGAEDDDGIL